MPASDTEQDSNNDDNDVLIVEDDDDPVLIHMTKSKSCDNRSRVQQCKSSLLIGWY